MLVWCVVEAGSGDLGGEPVGFGEADGEGDEVLLDLLLGELVADLVEGLDSLRELVRRMWYVQVACLTLSRTSGSSIVARFSSGERSTCP